MKMSSLPPHVYAVQDRHGKTRFRFVRKGWKSAYLPSVPGAPEFHEAYAEIVKAGAQVEPVTAARHIVPESLDDLYAKIRNSTRWVKKSDRTRYVQSLIIERFLNRVDNKGRRYGARPVNRVTARWLDIVFGEMIETPAAANVLRKILAGLMDYAMYLEWRTDNPVRLTAKLPENKEGHHDWTDAEIAQYRAHHKLGTMARFTLELALNTAARRCNIATLTRDDIKDGRIIVAHVKGNNSASVPLLATTKAALDALPVSPIKYLVATHFGKPFSVAGLGNRMRKWCNEAGLEHCSMHGLRKAISRQLAEAGATDAEGQAVTGHKKASTFQHYRAKANRVVLADRAFSNLANSEISNPNESGGNAND